MKNDLEQQFNQLWQDTAGRIRAYMYCGCNNWPDADDLVQDCYLRILKGWDGYASAKCKKAWLFTIARNTRIDWLRKQNTGLHTRQISQKAEQQEKTNSSENNQLELVWQAVTVLKEQSAEVVHLRFAAGLSYDEIAETLEISVGTVRSRLHRALKQLRKQIGGIE